MPFHFAKRKLGADPNESKRGAITHVCGGIRAGKPGLQSIAWAQRRHVHGTLQLNIEGIRQVWQGGRFKGPGTSQDITKPRRASDARGTHNPLSQDLVRRVPGFLGPKKKRKVLFSGWTLLYFGGINNVFVGGHFQESDHKNVFGSGPVGILRKVSVFERGLHQVALVCLSLVYIRFDP